MNFVVTTIGWILFFAGIGFFLTANALASVSLFVGSGLLFARRHEVNNTLEEGWGIDTFYVYPFALALGLWLAVEAYPGMMLRTLQMLFALSAIWLPVFLFYAFWIKWIEYVRGVFLMGKKFTLLEIKVPKVVSKSPRAMEVFLTSLHQPQGETTFIDRWWLGKSRAYFSLELISMGGDVHFYIWTRQEYKNHIEARLYAQYPEVQVIEVDDYAKSVDFHPPEWLMHCVHMKFGKPDPYPIKTYVDYELDKDPKTEHVVDPLANVIETLGSLQKNEYLWIQIIIRAHKKDEWHGFFLSSDSLLEDAESEKRKTLEKVKEDVEAATGQKMDRPVTYRDVSEQQRTVIKAIDRAVAKLSFEVGFRLLYFAPKEIYRSTYERITSTVFKPFDTADLNSLKHAYGTNKFDYPWQDFMNIRAYAMMRRFFKHYRKRAYFFWPYKQPHIIMNVEELATIWHFPSEAVATPTLERIPSKTAGAPANLPTGQSST